MPDSNTHTLNPEDFAGTWLGTLHAGALDLRIVFNLVVEGGRLVGTLDSPDQGMNGIPIPEVLTKSGGVITIGITAAAATFKGRLQPPDLINGTWMQSGQSIPLELKKQPAPLDYSRPQDPKGPFPYGAIDITFPNEEAHLTLAGTFTFPKTDKPVPAVVLISGSGAQNRNEELMGHRPFLVLADYLTRRGIAVLRYDDRGVGGSQGNPALATSQDFASDVTAAVRYILTQHFVGISQIGLIGHSEGGMIAPMVARVSSDIGFIVLLAGPGCPGKEILLQQSEAIMRASGASETDITTAGDANRAIYELLLNDEPVEAKKQKIHASLRAAGITDENQIQGQIAMLTSPWFLFFLAHDPIPVLEQLSIPVLALNGSLDLQVLSGPNLQAIKNALQKAGNTGSMVKEFPGLNHLFQTAQTGLMMEYPQIAETISPRVLELIATWIAGLH